VKALVVGHSEPAGALTSALSEQGVEAELHAVPRAPEGRAVGELAAALVDLEGRLAARSSDVAIAVGTGDGPLGLAERRILGELANLDAGPVGDGPAAFEAARRIAGWLAGRSGADPART
jgi:hypothetical protein